ncbi:aldehyde dehydrogenase family protein [Xenorhabdus bovienii]|uniref:Aldehyde dehydrogenase family protein n=1 Tax=Xenorhabdus bovienii TaxID=40576 RepID=A0AAJ1N0C5_XENBV|nr:aldehyde dehydrogenase family protein [Xenorhabdus bovienii]MDE1479724.1 aldehyde dehydrogenase family protein [Xenorhabdus bovienii]MDE1491159.1 aldehyde dehydrogenase family protein [Xenorhabdus bovienii]MDE9511543.1 aldehyde dehydrogenase family protein [Xenorhabdus bovienii]MDE9523172.1 aldehyde dehydrogenase family protein [Xenorhabdus bovienii]
MLEQDEKTPELPLIEAITPIVQKCFTQQKMIHDVQGVPVGRLTQVPTVYAHYTVNCLRQGESFPVEKLDEALQKAAEFFINGNLCGLTVDDYVAKVISVTGLPEHVVKNAVKNIGHATASAVSLAQLGIPQGVPTENTTKELENGCAQCIRRGDVLAVIAPGNGPGVHAVWPQAIALGYRVVLRPSDREPYTAQRLIQAMSEAGLGGYVAMLPSDHSLVDELLDIADLSVIYGGDALVDRFAHRSDILVQGPGRSKIVIGADYPRNAALELVFESVIGLGGAACVCTSSVLVEGDAAAFAHEFHAYVVERLKNEQERHRYLPQFSAERYSWWLEQVTQYANALVQTPDVFDTPSGVKRVMPLIMLAESFDSPLIQLEFPVAAVTFAPFNCDDNLDVIAPALVVTVASENPSLISYVADIPAIRNLYIGQVPTVWMQPHVPHDAFIAEFLMTTRGYRVAYSASMSG